MRNSGPIGNGGRTADDAAGLEGGDEQGEPLERVGPASVVLRVRGVSVGDRKHGNALVLGLVAGIETSPMP